MHAIQCVVCAYLTWLHVFMFSDHYQLTQKQRTLFALFLVSYLSYHINGQSISSELSILILWYLPIGACFSRVEPTPVVKPQTIAVSPSGIISYHKQILELMIIDCYAMYVIIALALIDIPVDATKHDEFAEYFSGNKVLPGAEPAAHCYCGHQFGSFAGQLGDGATMYLGEVMNHKGERIELQFKGMSSLFSFI
jgi:hypothetical protein